MIHIKKARIIGAVGLAPALGLALPVAAANAATAHHPTAAERAKAVFNKRVRLPTLHGDRIDAADAACDSYYVASGHKGPFYAFAAYSTNCLHFAEGVLTKEQTKLEMRISVYKDFGKVDRQKLQYVHGTISDGTTAFWAYVNVAGAHELCEALVASSNVTDVKYGPVCISFSA